MQYSTVEGCAGGRTESVPRMHRELEVPVVHSSVACQLLLGASGSAVGVVVVDSVGVVVCAPLNTGSGWVALAFVSSVFGLHLHMELEVPVMHSSDACTPLLNVSGPAVGVVVFDSVVGVGWVLPNTGPGWVALAFVLIGFDPRPRM